MVANGIANKALSTERHVSARAGWSGRARQHQMSVDGPASTGDHDELAAPDQEVAGSNPAERTEKPQVRAGVTQRVAPVFCISTGSVTT